MNGVIFYINLAFCLGLGLYLFVLCAVHFNASILNLTWGFSLTCYRSQDWSERTQRKGALGGEP